MKMRNGCFRVLACLGASLTISGVAVAQSEKKVAFAPFVSVARPLEFQAGVSTRFFGKFALDTSYGFDQQKGDSLKGKVQGLHLNAKWFPWVSSLFVGASANALLLDFEAPWNMAVKIDDVLTNVPFKLSSKTMSVYVRPNLGFDFTWKSGFLVGFDVGYSFPLSSSTKISSKFPDEFKEYQSQLEAFSAYAASKKETEDDIDSIIKKPLLSLTLIRLGWIL